MKFLFEVKDIDRKIYKQQIHDFIPEKIIDIHTHVWLEKFKGINSDAQPRVQAWPSRVARDNSIDDLLETYKLMFPNKRVLPMIFGIDAPSGDIEGMNIYVSKSATLHSLPSLIFAVPQWNSSKFEAMIINGKFLGAKCYLKYAAAYIPVPEIRIFDFIPHHQLEILNKHGWILMLHIPRDGRLKDPVNLAQMIEIEKRYPDIKLIIAHVGRAYCNEDVGNAFERLAETKNMLFDFSANCNEWVFEQLIKAVGSKRILFGSDMPILRMRTRRICENGRYINLVPKGLYGNISGDPHIREVEDKEAEKLTFFMYEEINAFRRAAETCRLKQNDIENVFYNNSFSLIESAKEKTC